MIQYLPQVYTESSTGFTRWMGIHSKGVTIWRRHLDRCDNWDQVIERFNVYPNKPKQVLIYLGENGYRLHCSIVD